MGCASLCTRHVNALGFVLQIGASCRINVNLANSPHSFPSSSWHPLTAHLAWHNQNHANRHSQWLNIHNSHVENNNNLSLTNLFSVVVRPDLRLLCIWRARQVEEGAHEFRGRDGAGKEETKGIIRKRLWHMVCKLLDHSETVTAKNLKHSFWPPVLLSRVAMRGSWWWWRRKAEILTRRRLPLLSL